jgi:hypothetical protein
VRCFAEDDCLIFYPALNSGFPNHSCIWLKTNELCSGANALKAHRWVTDKALRQLRLVVQHIIYRAVLLACTSPIPAGIKQKLISAASLHLCCTYLFPILFARTWIIPRRGMIAEASEQVRLQCLQSNTKPLDQSLSPNHTQLSVLLLPSVGLRCWIEWTVWNHK